MDSELFHILLVEDNAADVYLFRKALETAEVNFELTVISDGAEALTFVGREGKYSEHPVPDLAVLDLNLPRKGGDEILAAIRANRHFANVPVVIASSSSSPGEQSRVQQLGVERYLQKPPDLEEFLQIGMVLKQILLAGSGGRRLPPSE
jgi:CheY-like chemotaxis protein